MPELPEIETIKSVLEPQIRGAAIQGVTVSRPEVVAHPDAETFCARLVGQTIFRMSRQGKYLTVHLTSGDYFTLHLRMTGCLLTVPPDSPAEKHTHIVFRLDNGLELRFSDTRRFGRFWLFAKGETDTYSGVEALGVEPLSNGLTAAYLRTHFDRRKKPIKECLMEQKIIAGIGNIYADEILFSARLHPSRPASSLTAGEWVRLTNAIPEVLAYFIEKNAVTPEEYLQGKGQDYRNTPFLQVYGHEGDPCTICGTTLCRLVIGGRSSTYCPSCQKDSLLTTD